MDGGRSCKGSGDCTTIGGWVMELLGHIPDAGETVERQLPLHRTGSGKPTIQSIRLEVTPPPAENGESK
ncbi:transporter associated domain-containing protein [Ruminococcus sp.]|uniref:transporter associated domain-containing protein n=1 Tax=Ruminococcus sp. TaxID=41978 RepID=UPI0039968135